MMNKSVKKTKKIINLPLILYIGFNNFVQSSVIFSLTLKLPSLGTNQSPSHNYCMYNYLTQAVLKLVAIL